MYMHAGDLERCMYMYMYMYMYIYICSHLYDNMTHTQVFKKSQ